VVYRAAIFNNGTEQDNIHDMNKFATGTDAASMDAMGFVTVTTGSDIDIRIRHDNGGTVAITPIYASIRCVRVGD